MNDRPGLLVARHIRWSLVLPLRVVVVDVDEDRLELVLADQGLGALVAIESAGHVCRWDCLLALELVTAIEVTVAFVKPAVRFGAIEQEVAVLVLEEEYLLEGGLDLLAPSDKEVEISDQANMILYLLHRN